MRVNLRGLLIFALILGIAFALVIARIRTQEAADRAAHDSQRQDYALCLAQNTARKSERTTATATYNLVSAVLREGGLSPRLEHVFKVQERTLSRQLAALRPLDCATYVRPDLPPDRG